MAIPLSRKVTVPVIVPGVADVTVAVKVTESPGFEGFNEDVSVVVVGGREGLNEATTKADRVDVVPVKVNPVFAAYVPLAACGAVVILAVKLECPFVVVAKRWVKPAGGVMVAGLPPFPAT
jgi:hypothetical protein